jgi:hypothetical protein
MDHVLHTAMVKIDKVSVENIFYEPKILLRNIGVLKYLG